MYKFDMVGPLLFEYGLDLVGGMGIGKIEEGDSLDFWLLMKERLIKMYTFLSSTTLCHFFE